MIIREMKLTDLDQVLPIETENFSLPWKENDFSFYLTKGGALFLVAEEDDHILGYCGVILTPPEGDITNVSVGSAFRGKGAGLALVQEMLKQTEARGITTLFLEVRKSNDPAIGLYRKLGFTDVCIRKNYYEYPLEDALIMTRVSDSPILG